MESRQKFPEELKAEVDKKMWAHRKPTYQIEMLDEEWRSLCDTFRQESNARRAAFYTYFNRRLAEKIASGEIDSSKMDTRGPSGDFLMFENKKDTSEEDYSYRAVADIYIEWALANLPKIEGAEQLAAEAGEFWAGYRARLLATYNSEFVPLKNTYQIDVATLSQWLTDGNLSLEGFYSGEAVKDKGFDLSLFQDDHKNQTIQTIVSIKPEWAAAGSEVNTHFESNVVVQARADYPFFLDKLEKAIVKFFEAPESENMELAAKNAVEILKRRLDDHRRAFSVDEASELAYAFGVFICKNPNISEQVKFSMIKLLGKTLDAELDKTIVDTAFTLKEGIEDNDFHRDIWMLYNASVTSIDKNEVMRMKEPDRRELLTEPIEKNGFYYSSKMIDSGGSADWEHSLTSMERVDLTLSKLIEDAKITEALNLIKEKLGKLSVHSTKDPCKGVHATGEGQLDALIAKFDDPEIKKRIEREVKKGWNDPMGFRADAENLNVRAFWLELVKRGKEKSWPKNVLDALYDNAVFYDYTVGNW